MVSPRSDQSSANTPARATLSSAIAVAAAAGIARARGADVDAVLRDLDIDPAVFDQEDAMLPSLTAARAWDRFADELDDPFFGLNAHAAFARGTTGLVEFLIRSSATLGEAWAMQARYRRLVQDVCDVEVVVSGGRARQVQRPFDRDVFARRQLNDYRIGALHEVTRELLGEDVVPTAIRVVHDAPPDPEPYRAYFGVMPEFGWVANEIEVPADWLERATVSADPILHGVLERQADALLEQLPSGRVGVIDDARAAIARNVFGGDASVEGVAETLGLSARTFQRRLNDAGTSHQKLLEEVRRDTSLRLLERPELSVAEVARMLGYSRPSAFHRAFKRWTGLSPTAARARGG